MAFKDQLAMQLGTRFGSGWALVSFDNEILKVDLNCKSG